MEIVNFTIEVTRAKLRAALIFSAVKDIRYYLNGVCLHVGEYGDARLVSTDGHRLAVIKICEESDATPGKYILPYAALKSIKKAAKRDRLPLLLTIENDRFKIYSINDEANLCDSRLIDGFYLDWTRVVPNPSELDGTPGTFDTTYLADIKQALLELGDQYGLYYMYQGQRECNNHIGIVVNNKLGFLAIVMGVYGFDKPELTPDIAQFMPCVKQNLQLAA